MKNIIISLFLLGLTTSVAIAQTEEITTSEGTLSLTPILHSTMALEFNGKTIYIDPYGGAAKFADLKHPDLILITDIHGDHLNLETLTELDTGSTTFVVPQAVSDKMDGVDAKETLLIANGESINWQGIRIEALPMYNLPESEDSRHTKGRGNAYVLTFADKRIYISGDTEDIPEMLALKDIDYAFVCMNLPYTMDINQAADAVLEFKPGVVYPFHYRGGGGKFSDVEAFKTLVNNGDSSIEVRVRDWYMK
jgi:L-ascorbate metabolism protein UlaG (beta-lactamase superfamily)